MMLSKTIPIPVPKIISTPLKEAHEKDIDDEKEDEEEDLGASVRSVVERSSSLPTHLYVLPVLLLEFLALAITRAVLPSLIIHTFKDNVYFIMGCAECIRGLLAFIACPLFGKVSDSVGRKKCLFITVMGTCAPVCSLALMSYTHESYESTDNSNSSTTATVIAAIPPPQRIWIFVYLLALSGVFSSTFTLVFAYISDVVPKQADRVSAYGLALATFGLSFTLGPMAGGYLARVETVVSSTAEESIIYNQTYVDFDMDNQNTTTGDTATASASIQDTPNEGEPWGTVYPLVDPIGQQRVFTCALILTIVDLLYIYFILPESLIISKTTKRSTHNINNNNSSSSNNNINININDYDSTSTNNKGIQERLEAWKEQVLPQSWTPLDTLRVFSGDPLLAEVGRIAFLYYTGVWAVISTMVIYATKRFHFGPERLGELMSAFGLCTMLAEAVLLRIVVPILGEKRTMRLGLLAFAVQCAVLGLAFEGWQLFICVALSMLSNLVYPSLASLVSEAVAPDAVGEALGAVNGVKALTEGIGPLLFGGLMTISEKSSLPGWPYLVAAIFAVLAYRRVKLLPDQDDDDDMEGWYINEKYSGARSKRRREGKVHGLMKWFGGGSSSPNRLHGRGGSVNSRGVQAILSNTNEEEEEEELCALLNASDTYGDEEGVEMQQQRQQFIATEQQSDSAMTNSNGTDTLSLRELSFFSANL